MKTTTWQLIRSLSASEKAAAKRFLLRHVINGESDMATLFDALAAMDSYDEDALRQRHSGARFLKRLPAAKNELTHLILRAMRAYHHDKTTLHRLTSMLQDVHFLNSRGLFEMSHEIMEKAIALSHEVDDPILRLKLLMLSSNIMKGRQVMDQQAVDTLASEMSTAVSQASDLSEAEALATWISLAIIDNTPVDAERRAALERTCVEAYDMSAPPNLRLARLHTAVCYTQFEGGRPDEAERHERAATDVYRHNPTYARHAPKSHLLSITNLITLAVINRRFDEARTLTTEAWSILERERGGWPARLVADFEMRIVNSTLHRVSASSCFHEITDEVDNILARIRSFGRQDRAAAGVAALFNLAIVALAVGRHETVFEIDREMSAYPDHLRPDLHRNMELFLLLAHYECGNLALVESRARSIRRRLARQNDLAPDEDILLSTLQRLINRPGHSAARTILAESARRLDEVRAAQGNRARTDPFAPALWMKGQAQRIGYAAAIRAWAESVDSE